MEEVDTIILVTLRHIGAEVPDDMTRLKGLLAGLCVAGLSDSPGHSADGGGAGGRDGALRQRHQRQHRGASRLFRLCVFAPLAHCIGHGQLPTALPAGMSARFRVGTSLAAAVKTLGYSAELGYNNFLYPNENDARALLMWLVDRLPKDTATSSEPEGGGTCLALDCPAKCCVKQKTQKNLTNLHTKTPLSRRTASAAAAFRRSAVAALVKAQNTPWVPQYCLRDGFRWHGSSWQLAVSGLFFLFFWLVFCVVD
jgi:hypothetical protein